MFLMTARVSKRRIAAAACVLIALICGLFFFFRRPETAETLSASPAPVEANTNEKRVKYLEGLGWKVSQNPKESMQVRIPREPGEVFTRYNELQKSQGFDLSKLAGKTVMRYVYTIENYPGAADPVHATLLVYKDHVVGGDVTDTSPQGKIRGLACDTGSPKSEERTAAPAASAPTEPSEPQPSTAPDQTSAQPKRP